MGVVIPILQMGHRRLEGRVLAELLSDKAGMGKPVLTPILPLPNGKALLMLTTQLNRRLPLNCLLPDAPTFPMGRQVLPEPCKNSWCTCGHYALGLRGPSDGLPCLTPHPFGGLALHGPLLGFSQSKSNCSSISDLFSPNP